MKLYRYVVVLCLLGISFAEAQIGSMPNINPSRTNPAISVNGLFLGRVNNKGSQVDSEAPNGFHLQEAELQFTSNIDTYFSGNVVLAVEKEPGEEFGIEPEEVYVETLSIPSVTFRFGKFYNIFGRHNHFHTHVFPFIDAPLANEKILGDEALNQTGVAGAVLLPTPWYSDVVIQILSADNDLFRTDSANTLVGVYQWKNLWDLSDLSTLEFLIAAGHGENDFDRKTLIYDVSATYKWRQSRNKSFSLTTEYLRADQHGATEDVRRGGLGVWMQYQFAQQYWFQLRTDYLGLPSPIDGIDRRYSALIGYVPTEYSAIRLQYDHLKEGAEEDIEHRVTLQLNVSLGTHPAHNY